MAKNRGLEGLKYAPLQIYELFSGRDYYIVPTYQRGYSWTTDEVKELMADLLDAYQNFPSEEYLLGQLIVCPAMQENLNLDSDVTQWDLIDGQQRCTTIFIFIACALRKIKRALSRGEISLTRPHKKLIEDWMGCIEVFENDESVIPRLKAASNGGKYLSLMLEYLDDEKLTEQFDFGRPEGPTQQHILDAIAEIETTLEEQEAGETFTFLKFVATRGQVVRLALNTHQHALRVFQKVNNRGLQLDDADLIKSFLFQSADSQERFDELSEAWDEATIKLFSAKNKRLKQMENLTKFLIGIRTGKSISKGNLYEEWSKQLQGESGTAKLDEVIRFAYQLKSEASNLVLISEGKVPVDQQKSDLIQGTLDARWIQPFEVLLAGAHLESSRYRFLLRLVENRTMLSFWSKEKNNTFEALIHPWAREVKNLDSLATEDDIRIASKVAVDGFQDLSARAYIGICAMRYSTQSHRQRMRYILARVHSTFQGQLTQSPPSMSDLLKTPNTATGQGGFHLDHIFPQAENRKNSWRQSIEKDKTLGSASRYESAIHSIGNLVLLHPADNRSQSDAMPWDNEKQQNLVQSELLLNRVLANKNFWPNPEHRVQTTLEELVAKHDVEVSDASKYSEDKIDALSALYWEVIETSIRREFGID